MHDILESNPSTAPSPARLVPVGVLVAWVALFGCRAVLGIEDTETEVTPPCDPTLQICPEPDVCDPECLASAPVCSAGTCGPCSPGADGDALCMAGFPDAPVCADPDGAGGRCVECRASSDCPAGDACLPGNICGPCVENDQCDSLACVQGQCAIEADVLYVDGGNGDDANPCTLEDPCASIGGALAFDNGMSPDLIVLLGSPQEVYQDSIYLYAANVTILGNGATLESAEVNDPVFDVIGGSQLYISDLRIAGAFGTTDVPSADGINCENQSLLTLERVTIEDNGDKGLEVLDCDLIVTRSRIRGNRGGGMHVENSSYVIVNNFITGNGGPTSPSSGVNIANLGDFSSPRFFEFNTIVDNTADPNGTTSGLWCTSIPNFQGYANIVYGGNPELPNTFMTNCAMNYSIMEDWNGGGEGNIGDPPLFQDAEAGDYRLAPGSVGIDWFDEETPGETTIDFDGEARPLGGRYDVGADEFNPAP